MALGKFKLALKDFEAVVKTRPRDVDAKVSSLFVLVKTNAYNYPYLLYELKTTCMNRGRIWDLLFCRL